MLELLVLSVMLNFVLLFFWEREYVKRQELNRELKDVTIYIRSKELKVDSMTKLINETLKELEDNKSLGAK